MKCREGSLNFSKNRDFSIFRKKLEKAKFTFEIPWFYVNRQYKQVDFNTGSRSVLPFVGGSFL